MLESYPDHSRTVSARKLTISDFPRRVKGWTPATVSYFQQRSITVTQLTHLTSVYPTVRGVCYVLNGSVLGFQERITAPSPVRFFSPPGMEMAKLLYMPNFSLLSLSDSPVYIFEGATDALAAYQCGQHSVAVMGAMVSPEQLAMLRALSLTRRLTLIPDNDEAGLKCAKTLTKELPIQVKYLPTDCKDFCEMSVNDRQRFLLG